MQFYRTEEEMPKVIKRCRKYLKRKKLMLNTQKARIIIFKKGGREQRDEYSEMVKNLKYLGMWFRNNDSKDGHIIQTKTSKKSYGNDEAVVEHRGE